MFSLFFGKITPLIIVTYITLMVLVPMRLGWKKSLAIFVFMLFCTSKAFLYELFGGHVMNPVLPEWYLNLTGFLFSIFLFWMSLLLLPPYTFKRDRVCRKALVTFVIATILAAWGMLECLMAPVVKCYDLEFANLPAAFDGLRIVQISDTHMSGSSPRRRTQKVVALANSLKPDLIVITGDFVDGKIEDRLQDVEPLAALHAPLGVYGCTGNHEFYSNYRDWRPVFERCGVTMLDNTHRFIYRGGEYIVLAGTIDSAASDHYFPHFYNEMQRSTNSQLAVRYQPFFMQDALVATDISTAFEGAPRDAFRILLMHQPNHTQEIINAGTALQLAGHTHGGMIAVIGRIVGEMGNCGHYRGIYEYDNMKLVLSAGTGQWSGFPVRLATRPEIVQLTLHRKTP